VPHLGVFLMKGKNKTKATKTRKQQLGDYGECRALHLLSENGLVEKMPRNFPFFDLMSKQGTRRLLIAVRTRNKFTAKGTLKKDHYNLYTKTGHFESATKIANFFRAKIKWIAVTVDTKEKTFSVCMGDVSKLRSPKYIPMHPTRHVPGYNHLTTDQPDPAISQSWSNIAGTVGG
jgi:hypothetical protein